MPPKKQRKKDVPTEEETITNVIGEADTPGLSASQPVAGPSYGEERMIEDKDLNQRPQKRPLDHKDSSDDENKPKKPSPDALSTALTATNYVSNMLSKLAAVFEHKDGLRELIQMLHTALCNVTSALEGLRSERKNLIGGIEMKNASTSTETKRTNKKVKGNKLDHRTPNFEKSSRKMDRVHHSNDETTTASGGDKRIVPLTSTNNGAIQSNASPEPSQAEWSTVVKKGLRPKISDDYPPLQGTTPMKPKHPKPTAILVKVAEGTSYLETVKLIKSSRVDVTNIGAPIKDMRKTRTGDLLIELAGGIKAYPVADSLRRHITEKLEERAGPIHRLSSCVDAEIVGVNAKVDQDEVLRAVRETVTGEDAASTAERNEIQITGL